MTITAEGIYGGQEQPAATTEAVQVRTWRIPRTEPPDGPLAPPFVARSVLVDNATGRWWLVAGRWIPPWVIGAQVPVDPPATQLEVLARTPAGRQSIPVGDELVVVASSATVDPNPGIYQEAPAAGNLVSVVATVATELGATVNFAWLDVPGQRINPTRLELAANTLSNDSALRGIVRGSLANQAGVSLGVALAISPEQPISRVELDVGALEGAGGTTPTIGPGEYVGVALWSARGCGRQSIVASLHYVMSLEA